MILWWIGGALFKNYVYGGIIDWWFTEWRGFFEGSMVLGILDLREQIKGYL